MIPTSEMVKGLTTIDITIVRERNRFQSNVELLPGTLIVYFDAMDDLSMADLDFVRNKTVWISCARGCERRARLLAKRLIDNKSKSPAVLFCDTKEQLWRFDGITRKWVGYK